MWEVNSVRLESLCSNPQKRERFSWAEMTNCFRGSQASQMTTNVSICLTKGLLTTLPTDLKDRLVKPTLVHLSAVVRNCSLVLIL